MIYGHAVKKINTAGQLIDIAGDVQTTGYVEGAGAVARFNFARGIMVDGSGNVFVMDTNNHAIRKITPGGMVSTLTQTNFPSDGVIDSAGNIYFPDWTNPFISKVTPAGVVSLYAGSIFERDSRNGPRLSARFQYQAIYDGMSLTIDSNDNLYVRDGRILRKISPAGEVTTLAGNDIEPTYYNAVGLDAGYEVSGKISSTRRATSTVWASMASNEHRPMGR